MMGYHEMIAINKKAQEEYESKKENYKKDSGNSVPVDLVKKALGKVHAMALISGTQGYKAMIEDLASEYKAMYAKDTPNPTSKGNILERINHAPLTRKQKDALRTLVFDFEDQLHRVYNFIDSQLSDLIEEEEF